MIEFLFWGIVVGVGVILLLIVLSLWIRFIPNTRVGIVEKRWSAKGSIKSGFIALNGEAGFQPNLLRGGIHLLPPFQYAVHRAPLVTIPQGRIGYVFARDGQPLSPTQALASNATAHDFQDVTAFMRDGGTRGPQRIQIEKRLAPRFCRHALSRIPSSKSTAIGSVCLSKFFTPRQKPYAIAPPKRFYGHLSRHGLCSYCP